PLLSASCASYSLSCDRSLRPFPTRRSSDLGALAALLDARLGLRVEGDGVGAQRRGGGVALVLSAAGLRLREANQRGAHGHSSSLDRKSTRLNSSHVSSSYAVFCLKHRRVLS